MNGSGSLDGRVRGRAAFARPPGLSGADLAAGRAGGRDQEHQSDRDGDDHLQRALQHRPALRVHRPHQRRPRGGEPGDVPRSKSTMTHSPPCPRLAPAGRLPCRCAPTTTPVPPVFNLRAFKEQADTLFTASRRNGLPLCALLVDIDHFNKSTIPTATQRVFWQGINNFF